MKKFWRWTLTIALVLAITAGTGLASAETVETVIAEETTVVTSNSGMSNDDAAAGYIRKIMSGGETVSDLEGRGVYAGDLLTGTNRVIYNLLKPQIEAVAAGKRESTDFTVPLSAVYANERVTAEEAGLKEISTEADNETAKTALLEKAQKQYNLRTILNALLADCPYDLYWFDKTTGVAFGGSFTFSKTSQEFWFSNYDSANVYFYFTVATEYQKAEYKVNTTFGQAVARATDKVQGIVKAYESKSDYEKLVAYKNEICNLVSYNSDAASDEWSDGYGNPWQLVWVFDGDDTTNVVCEGYSKAFQFLCDESTFEGQVNSIIATGTMSGGTGAGRHMWNIVTMNNGEHYLADVTNSDEGTVGANGGLFLSGYSDDTTKTTAGNTVYKYNVGSSTIGYYYDAATLSTYTAEDLAVSGSAYDPDAQLKILKMNLELPTTWLAGKDYPFSWTRSDAGERVSFAIYMLDENGNKSEVYSWDSENGDDTLVSGRFMDEGDYLISGTATAEGYDDYKIRERLTVEANPDRPEAPQLVLPFDQAYLGMRAEFSVGMNWDTVQVLMISPSEHFTHSGDRSGKVYITFGETGQYTLIARGKVGDTWSRDAEPLTFHVTQAEASEKIIVQGRDEFRIGEDVQLSVIVPEKITNFQYLSADFIDQDKKTVYSDIVNIIEHHGVLCADAGRIISSFSVKAGEYTIRFTYYDPEDGETILYQTDYPITFVGTRPAVPTMRISPIQVNAGDTIKLSGTAGDAEKLRLEYWENKNNGEYLESITTWMTPGEDGSWSVDVTTSGGGWLTANLRGYNAEGLCTGYSYGRAYITDTDSLAAPTVTLEKTSIVKGTDLQVRAEANAEKNEGTSYVVWQLDLIDKDGNVIQQDGFDGKIDSTFEKSLLWNVDAGNYRLMVTYRYAGKCSLPVTVNFTVEPPMLSAAVITGETSYQIGEEVSFAVTLDENCDGYAVEVYMDTPSGSEAQIFGEYASSISGPEDRAFTINLSEDMFDKGSYWISVAQYNHSGAYRSITTTLEFMVTGTRPAAPELTMQSASGSVGDTLIGWVKTAAGAARVQYRLNDWGAEKTYATTGTVTEIAVPLHMDMSERETISVRALYDGTWSSWSEWDYLEVEKAAEPVKPTSWNPTLPDSLTPGEDAVVTHPAVEDAAFYVVYVYDMDADFYVFSRYDDDPGTFTIPYIYFAQGGNYCVMAGVGCEEGGREDWLWDQKEYYSVQAMSAGTKLTVTPGKEIYAYQETIQATIQATPAVTVISEVIFQDGEEVADAEIIDSAKGTISFNYPYTGKHEFRFAALANGVWTAWSDPVTITIEDAKGTLDPVEPVLPKEAYAGELVTITWNAVKNAESYTLSVITASKAMEYDTDKTSYTIPAAEVKAGWMEIYASANAKGYYSGWNDVRQTLRVWAKNPDQSVMTLPKGLKTLEDEALSGVAATKIVLPDGCESIGARAFAGCANLQVIVLPSSVKSIDTNAFAGCGEVTILTPAGSAAESFAWSKGIRVINK